MSGGWGGGGTHSRASARASGFGPERTAPASTGERVERGRARAVAGRCRVCGVFDNLVEGVCAPCRSGRTTRVPRQAPRPSWEEPVESEQPAEEPRQQSRIGWAGGLLLMLLIGLPGWRYYARGAPAPVGEAAPAAASPSSDTRAVWEGLAPARADVPGTFNTEAWRAADAEAGVAYREGRFDEALARFEDALAEKPGDAEALNNIGQTLVQLGRAAEAVPHLERAVAAAPSDWMMRFNLARALGEAERWPEAVVTYREAESLAPGLFPTLFNLARAQRAAGDAEGAVESYTKAAAINDTEPDVHLGLAACLEDLGKAPEAAAEYGRYLSLVPDGPQAARVRERLEALKVSLAASAGDDTPVGDAGKS